MDGSVDNRSTSDHGGWLVSFLLAVAAHAGVYQQFSTGMNLPAILDVQIPVRVSLVAAPVKIAEPEPVPQPVVPPPEPVVKVPEPKPEPKPKPKPVQPKKTARPKPVPVPVPVAEAVARVPEAERMAAAAAPLVLPRADAAYLRNPPPSYPRLLLRRGVEGTVLVRAEVQNDGHCSHVLLKESSGYRQFDEAALAAVKDWRFVPARKGTETVVAWVDVPIEFRISRTQ